MLNSWVFENKHFLFTFPQRTMKAKLENIGINLHFPSCQIEYEGTENKTCPTLIRLLYFSLQL